MRSISVTQILYCSPKWLGAVCEGLQRLPVQEIIFVYNYFSLVLSFTLFQIDALFPSVLEKNNTWLSVYEHGTVLHLVTAVYRGQFPKFLSIDKNNNRCY